MKGTYPRLRAPAKRRITLPLDPPMLRELTDLGASTGAGRVAVIRECIRLGLPRLRRKLDELHDDEETATDVA